MTRLLVVMGSGETTPTMVTPHQRLLEAAGPDPATALVDTPYGFQENADEITARSREYFARNVGHDVDHVALARPQTMSEVALRAAEAQIADADWVFAGPGSPTYLVRQWRATRVPQILRDRMTAGGGVTIVASAAAVTIGSHAVPVYEIYKAGVEPAWVDGLGLLQAAGLDAVLIPHYDNAEGGTHDTRFCYLGERRLAAMEDELPEGTWVLGVDEHTAMVVDLERGEVSVEGRGGVSVRRRGGATTVFGSGSTTTLDELRAAARSEADGATRAGGADADEAGTDGATRAGGAEADGAGTDRAGTDAARTEGARTGGGAAGSPLSEEVDAATSAFRSATEQRDATAATEAVLDLEGTVRAWAADTLTGEELDDAVDRLRQLVTRLGMLAERGMHDHRDVVAPFVDLLLELRAAARADGEYATADRIRDVLVGAGVEVRDTPDGVEWDADADVLGR